MQAYSTLLLVAKQFMHYLNAASVTEKNRDKPKSMLKLTTDTLFFTKAALLRPLKMLEMNLYTSKRKKLHLAVHKLSPPTHTHIQTMLVLISFITRKRGL